MHIQTKDKQEAGNANRFDQLFWDAENRRRRQAEYMQWHPEGLVDDTYIDLFIQS